MEQSALIEVAGMRLSPYDIEEVSPAQLSRHAPDAFLVFVHEGAAHIKFCIHPKTERNGERIDRVLPTVGISRIVGFTHATDDGPYSEGVGMRSGGSEEEQIAAGHERIGESVITRRYLFFARERRGSQRLEELHIEDEITCESSAPRKLCGKLKYPLAANELIPMPLTVVEAEGVYLLILPERQAETDGRILPAGKQQKCFFAVEDFSHSRAPKERLGTIYPSADKTASHLPQQNRLRLLRVF